MDLLKMLQDQLSGDLINQLSSQVGAEPQQTADAAQGIFTALVGGLANNASSPSGLNSLLSALDKDHDGSVLDDIIGLVSGSSSGTPAAANGLGILGHILGNKQEEVAQQVSQSSGLNMSQIMKLMPIIAPIVMGLIGKLRAGSHQQEQNPMQSGGGILDIAQILMGSAQSAQGGGFGNILGTVLGGVLNEQPSAPQQQSSGGLLGTIFGNLFKK